MAQLVKHPTLGPIEILGQPVDLERTPFQMRSASPEPGEHTEEVFREFDIDYDQIDNLRKRGVV